MATKKSFSRSVYFRRWRFARKAGVKSSYCYAKALRNETHSSKIIEKPNRRDKQVHLHILRSPHARNAFGRREAEEGERERGKRGTGIRKRRRRKLELEKRKREARRRRKTLERREARRRKRKRYRDEIRNLLYHTTHCRAAVYRKLKGFASRKAMRSKFRPLRRVQQRPSHMRDCTKKCASAGRSWDPSRKEGDFF